MAQTKDHRRNDRRDSLIASATASFRAHGPSSTGVGAICRASNVTKGVFSHHFPGGKNELLLEVMRRNAAEVDNILSHYLQTCESTGEAVVEVFGLYADLLDVDPDFGCPIAAAVVDASAKSVEVQQLASSSFRRWQDQVADARARQTGTVADPVVGTLVVAAFEGAILLARSQRDSEVLRSTAAALQPLLGVGR